MVIVITGASKGIGLGIAKSLVDGGHTVYSLSRTAPPDDRIKYIPCDVSIPQSIEAAFSEFFSKESRIDVLVNNAGMGISGPVENASPDDMHKIFDVNFWGSVNCTRAVIAKMREQQGGKILFVSSMGSIFTLAFQTFYSATKNAINSLTEGLIMELKPFGIRVGALLFGDINSQFTQNREKNPGYDPAYGDRVEKSLAVMERDELKGVHSDVIGVKVARYITKKRVKPYKLYGVTYKMFNFLHRILPRRTILWLLSVIYGG